MAIPVGECDLGVSNPPLICARCDGEVERGFQWDFDEIVVCEGCVVPIVAAMIFDAVRERHHHVTPDLVREIGTAIESRLKRISQNLDGGRLNDL